MTILDIINQRNITLDEWNVEMSYRQNPSGEANEKFKDLSISDLISIFCIIYKS